MSPSTIGLLSLILLMSCFLQVYSLPAAYICKGRKRGENCFVMINLLRSPLQSPNWSLSSWNRAMNQQKAYQQLFQDYIELIHQESVLNILKDNLKLYDEGDRDRSDTGGGSHYYYDPFHTVCTK